MPMRAGIDVATDPRAPRIAKTVEPGEIQAKTGLAYLHSSHCLGTGGASPLACLPARHCDTSLDSSLLSMHDKDGPWRCCSAQYALKKGKV